MLAKEHKGLAYDVEAIREQFPGLKRMEGDRLAVFFDNPAGTQIAQSAIDRMVDTMVHTNANLGGFFTTSKVAEQGVLDAHRIAADFVGTDDPSEIFFGQNMTTLTFAVSRAMGRKLQAGDEIILTRMDHDGNVTPWTMLAEDLGLVVRWLDFDTDTYEFDLSRLEMLLSDRTQVVAINHASNITGTINDIKSAAAMAKAHGALVFVDSVQYAPHCAIDVRELGCDFLICSAYKFYGPHYGLAWGRRAVLELLDAYRVRASSDDLPFKFVTGTTNREALAGTAGAIDYFAWVGSQFGQPANDSRRARIVAGYDAMMAHDRALVERLISGLGELRDIRVLGLTDPATFDRRVPTVSFVTDRASPDDIARFMAENGVYVWNGHNYGVEPCQAMGVLESGVLRVGPTHYNTLGEVDRFLELLGSFLRSS